MNQWDADEQLKALESQHGGYVYQGGWMYFQDGHIIEWSSTFGPREIGARTTEQKREIQRFYWDATQDRLQREFRQLKDRLTTKAESASLTAEDKAELKSLQRQVRHAATMCEELSVPEGPSDAEVRKAMTLYNQRKELAAAVHAAEAEYTKAMDATNGRVTSRSTKLGAKWEQAWNDWNEVNEQYQALSEDVQRAANLECWREEHDAKRTEQMVEVESIEI